MVTTWIFGIVLVVLSIVGAIVYAVHVVEKKRTESMRVAATALSFAFDPKPAESTLAHLTSLPVFNIGHSKKFRNLLTGEARGVRVTILDYDYTTGGGKHQHRHRQTLFAAQSESLSLPSFELRPEGFFHRVAAMFGYNDIDFTDRPLFSKLFLLKGTHEEDVRALFHDALFDYFESHKDVSAQAAGDLLIFFRQDKRHDAAKLAEFLKEGFELYALLKS